MRKLQEISLNPNAISQIPFEKYTKDFLFLVDGQKYFVSRFAADLISPTIRNMHYTDDSINSFSINTNGKFPNSNFSSFLSLLSFKSQSINSNSVLYFKYLFEALGNFEDSNLIKFKQTCTISNVVEQINQKWIFYHTANAVQNEIDFAASHFSEIEKERLKTLDLEIIDLILKNPNLKIDDEDTLLQFIIELYSENSNASFLFENINFLNVSIVEFTNFFNTFNFNDLTSKTWNSIMQRAIDYGQKAIDKQIKSSNINKFEYKSGKELDGIFKSLTNEFGGNISTKGIINIIASSEQPYHKASNLVDFNDMTKNSMWSPNGERNATLTFDFKERRIRLTHYTFHTPSNPTLDYPKSWSVMLSNDTQNWVLIDERFNVEGMNGFNVCHCFECKNQSDEFYRYVRIQTNGPCWNPRMPRYYFDLSAVEFFGFMK